MVNNKNGDKMEKILYTGGAGGIAKSVIDRIKNKYFIYIGVHNNKQLELVCNRYKNYQNIKVIKLDMLNDADLNKIKNLDIDILVCNAAIGYGGSVAEIDVLKLKEVFEVNVFSNVKLIQIVLKNMVKKGHGKIIIISSLISLITLPFLGSYASSKSALNKLVQVLKKEVKLINKNIKIYLIEPGMYKTGFNDIMLENKYNDMSIESYFKYQIESIRKKEKLFWGLFQKKSLNSITNKIIYCIEKGNKFIYSAPLTQRVFAKIYSLIYD